QDYPALVFLVSLLSFEIFQLNRIERELGYIQSAAYLGHGEESLIEFYGQTEGAENLKLMQRGWKEVCDRVRQQTYSLERLSKMRDGLVRNRHIEPVGALRRLSRMFSYFELT